MNQLLFLVISLFVLNLTVKSQSNDFKLVGGTSTITIVTKDTIWMAADSKHIYKISNSINKSGFHNKINEVNGTIFMISGTSTINDKKDSALVNFYTLMSKSLNKTNNVDSAIGNFKKEANEDIFKLIIQNPRFFYKISETQNILFQVSLAATVNSKPIARFFNFEIIKSGSSIGVNIVDEKHNNDTYMHPTGFMGEIKKVTNFPGFSWEPSLIKESLIYLIELEKKGQQ